MALELKSIFFVHCDGKCVYMYLNTSATLFIIISCFAGDKSAGNADSEEYQQSAHADDPVPGERTGPPQLKAGHG